MFAVPEGLSTAASLQECFSELWTSLSCSSLPPCPRCSTERGTGWAEAAQTLPGGREGPCPGAGVPAWLPGGAGTSAAAAHAGSGSASLAPRMPWENLLWAGLKPAGFCPELALALLGDGGALAQPRLALVAPVAPAASARAARGVSLRCPASSAPLWSPHQQREGLLSPLLYRCAHRCPPRAASLPAPHPDRLQQQMLGLAIASPKAESLLCLHAGWKSKREEGSAVGRTDGRDPTPSLG